MAKKMDIRIEYARLTKRLKAAEEVLKKDMPTLLKMVGCFFVQSVTKLTPMTKLKKRGVMQSKSGKRKGRWYIPYRFVTPRQGLGKRGKKWFDTERAANKSPFRIMTFRGLGKIGWQHITRNESISAALPSGITDMAKSYGSKVSESKFSNSIWFKPKWVMKNKSLTIKGFGEANSAMVRGIGMASNRLNGMIKAEKQKIASAFNQG